MQGKPSASEKKIKDAQKKKKEEDILN